MERVVAETEDSITIELERPDDPVFTAEPGQFLTLRIPSERTGSVARCYSLCSMPDEPVLAVTVRRTAEGYASNWLCDNIRADSKLEVLPPSGVFVPRSMDEDLLLIAGGSGITPIMSILRTVLVAGSAHITLLYANRDERSVIFAARLARLAEAYPDRLTVIHWLASLQGHPGPATLTPLLAPHTGCEAFICGPEPFMEAANAALDALGVHGDRIHRERFLSLSGDPFEEPELYLDAAGEADADEAGLTVSLDGLVHQLSWPRPLTLIELLIAKGIEAPYSCREGECGSCACTLLEGSVDIARSDTLDAADIADGYILGCQARPTSDEVVIEF